MVIQMDLDVVVQKLPLLLGIRFTKQERNWENTFVTVPLDT
jgi:hypothetical protein